MSDCSSCSEGLCTPASAREYVHAGAVDAFGLSLRASCPLAGWRCWSPADGLLKTGSGQLSCCDLECDAPVSLMVPRATGRGGSLLLLTPVWRCWVTLGNGRRSCLPLLCASGAPELPRRLIVGLGCCWVARVATQGACAAIGGAPALCEAGWHSRSLSCCLFLSVAAPAERQVPGGCSGIASLPGVACSGLLGCAEAGPQSASRDLCRAANWSSFKYSVTDMHISFWCPAALWQYSNTQCVAYLHGHSCMGAHLIAQSFAEASMNALLLADLLIECPHPGRYTRGTSADAIRRAQRDAQIFLYRGDIH